MSAVKVGVIIAITVVLLIGVFLWGAATQGTHVARKTCQELGFDGLVQVNDKFLCYTACPYYAAINGTCQP